MLYEISSDAFISHGNIRPPIRFSKGLNVVQGEYSGSNSIGKSTFLLAIDFAFGGDDYADQSTIKTEIGHHTIKFCFEFENIRYYFSRSTGEANIVKICDENYTPIDEIKLDEFRQRLFMLYKINLSQISFRNIVGRYFRIYGRDNIDEKHPLEANGKEKSESAISTLLKLYNCYSEIAVRHEEFEKRENERNAFSNAQKYKLIDKISSADYKNNLSRLEILKKEREDLAEKSETEFADVDVTKAEQAAELQTKITALRRQRGRLFNNYYTAKEASEFKRTATEQDFKSLIRFFPGANIRDFKEIEAFHSKISNILSDEFEESKRTSLSLVRATESEIEKAETLLKALNIPQSLSRATLTAYSNIERQIEAIESQNKIYLDQVNIDIEYKNIKKQLKNLGTDQISLVKNNINLEMERINDIIYNGKNKPPILNIKKLNSYTFSTPSDDGTGINYKNLAVFDMSILNLTPLPAIVHDTVIFKNIAVEPLGKIIELYNESFKQVFIAFDRTDSYLKTTQNIIENHTCLRLSLGGNELYGKSWNVKNDVE